jgi:hypothetical protein
MPAAHGAASPKIVTNMMIQIPLNNAVRTGP